VTALTRARHLRDGVASTARQVSKMLLFSFRREDEWVVVPPLLRKLWASPQLPPTYGCQLERDRVPGDYHRQSLSPHLHMFTQARLLVAFQPQDRRGLRRQMHILMSWNV
jgi:hypothetical protein